MLKECLTCSKIFREFPSRIKAGIGRYCSNKCKPSWAKGTKFSEEHKRRLGESKIERKNPNWRGGQCKNNGGYILILNPTHPFSTNRGYILKHRLVMEKHIGRYLTREEVIHHINGIKDDNRIENLMLLAGHGQHTKLHNFLRSIS